MSEAVVGLGEDSDPNPNPHPPAPATHSSGIDGRTQRQRGPGGRFLPLEGPPESPMQGLLRRCSALLNILMNHKYGYVFNEPVNPVELGIPDYFQVITHPMDLGTVKSKLRDNVYSNPAQFAADVRLTFNNALKYNPPGDLVHRMAKTLSRLFESKWKYIEKKMEKFDGSEHKSSSHFGVSEMPVDKKKAIISAFMNWDDDVPDEIVEFIKAHNTNVAEDGNEMELDINVLSNDQLGELLELVNRHLEFPHRRVSLQRMRVEDEDQQHQEVM